MAIHMGNTLTHLMHERGLTPGEMAHLLTPHLPFLKGTPYACSISYVYEIRQSIMWQPQTLQSVCAALQVDPALFLQDLPDAPSPHKKKIHKRKKKKGLKKVPATMN